MPKPFIFNDENQPNSYGFRILNKGISLVRFNKNPVMLDQHWNATSGVLGRWENIRVDKNLLLGEPIFDEEDQESSKVLGKVERGFISSCSMGISFNREDLKVIGTELILEKCELFECSVVAVPSNANAVRLYADNGVLLKEEEVKKLCLMIQTTPNEVLENIGIKKEKMKKMNLPQAVRTVLGFKTEDSEINEEVFEKTVLDLKNENTALKAKVLAFETETELAKDKAIDQMVTLAITQGKIPATKKEDFVNLAKSNFDLAKATIEAIPAKATLSNQIVAGAPSGVITKEAFQKLSTDQQLEFKTNDTDAYNKLFNIKK